MNVWSLPVSAFTRTHTHLHLFEMQNQENSKRKERKGEELGREIKEQGSSWG